MSGACTAVRSTEVDMIFRVLRALVLLVLALPAWAQDFGFRPPRDPDDAAAVELMRDLAQRIVPVYKEADTDVFLANMTALQIVSGTYRAAYDSSRSLRGRQQGKPFDALAERAILDSIYARARLIDANERIGFAKAYARSFQELVAPLDNAQAAALMAQLEGPLAQYREPVRQAFDRWRARGSVPQADAVALVRAWLAYESRRSVAALVPELIAAENRSRYLAEADVRIPVRGGVVIHASIVRPARAGDALPTLLRFTLDPAEDDAQRSAVKGYVGVTAYVRGRTPDGKGAVWPFVRDGEDAAAVIDWIARQPWSDGRVGMLGDGYSGYAAWAAARRKPPALKAIATIAPMAPGIDFPMAGQIYRNAMVRWAQEHAMAAPPRADAAADAARDARWRALDARWYRGHRPYWDVDRVLLGKRNKLIRTWLTHPSHDRYWRKFLPTPQQFAQIDIPVLGIAGYYGAEAGALYFHREHRRHRPQADTTLLLGPYDAASIRLGTAGQLRGYALDPVARVDLPELRYQWLDHVFKRAKKPALLQDRVNYEVMGADEWRHVPTLDAPDRAPLRLYLDTRERDGLHRLAPSPSPSESGGSTRLSVDLADRSDVHLPGPDALRLKQLPMRDSIAFVSDPLPKDTEIDGSLRGEFDITPSRQDMDFNVSLYEQTASGEYQLLFEPYDFRASYAGHRVYRRLLRAGERQLLAFTAERVTARKLAAGSRIVLLISLNKRPDRQINYGSGKDVNSETIADAKRPVRVRWHERSHVEIQTGRP
ncbi:CocE/NonD family hydrolase [Variovorax soli]|uniref:CocE/NonD family hydrolase n=1 Tax=Variovorax soli TaxID=376815 RepID=A0ABU1NKU3_9BURK|nr:CocE/NonD family hydrolase [Variovorax soli]MDR6539093.1 putative CocE/NonD family hydrolase [Variovorax soli]